MGAGGATFDERAQRGSGNGDGIFTGCGNRGLEVAVDRRLIGLQYDRCFHRPIVMSTVHLMRQPGGERRRRTKFFRFRER